MEISVVVGNGQASPARHGKTNRFRVAAFIQDGGESGFGRVWPEGCLPLYRAA